MAEPAQEPAVIEGQVEEPVIPKEAAPKSTPKVARSPGKKVPRWEAEARERVRTAVRRFNKPLADLVARDANEGDTRLLVTDFLCEGLGYDKYEDLTTEYEVKGEFADYGIRVDKQLFAFVEVKRCTQKLGVKHLRQVQMYAVNEGVEWMILTNGQVWQAWHMTPGLPVVLDLAMEVDLLGEGGPSAKADAMFYLSKDSFKHHLIDELWKARAATAPRALAKALLSENLLEALRKELRRQTGHNADLKEVERVLRDEVLQPGALD